MQQRTTVSAAVQPDPDVPGVCVSVSIVVYRPDLDLLIQVLQALALAGKCAGLARRQVRVTLVNNAPGDDALTRLQERPPWADLSLALELILKESSHNGGYGAGNNQAILASTAPFHLVLNPDALLAEDFFVHALSFFTAHAEVGLIVPEVRGFDGALHHLCKRHPTLPDLFLRSFAPGWVRRLFQWRMARFEMRDHDYAQVIMPVPYPTGCCMFFRGDLLRALGGFDERFFMYLEDADIGRRVNLQAQTAYVPACRVVHRWTRGSHHQWRLRWVTICSAFTYWRKWGGWLRSSG